MFRRNDKNRELREAITAAYAAIDRLVAIAEAQAEDEPPPWR